MEGLGWPTSPVEVNTEVRVLYVERQPSRPIRGIAHGRPRGLTPLLPPPLE